MSLRLIGCALVASFLVPATAWSGPPQWAELQVPVGQIEAFCNDFRQAFDQCVTGKGVPLASGQPLTDEQIQARAACRQEIDEEFDIYTASFCPGPDVDLAAADYAAMCVALNARIIPCLEKFHYHAVVGLPVSPEEYAHLRHCREQDGVDMTLAARCGPPAYRSDP
jgi:hypothetical protein